MALDIRIGLGYTAVLLENGSCGLAYTLHEKEHESCGVMPDAGKLAGRKAGFSRAGSVRFSSEDLINETSRRSASIMNRKTVHFYR
jgi:hypothetical protein